MTFDQKKALLSQAMKERRKAGLDDLDLQERMTALCAESKAKSELERPLSKSTFYDRVCTPSLIDRPLDLARPVSCEPRPC